MNASLNLWPLLHVVFHEFLQQLDKVAPDSGDNGNKLKK